MLDVFDIAKERFDRLGTFSKGMRQKVLIAAALLHDPVILLLDEPSLGLQPQLVVKTFDAVAEINRRGVSVLLVEQKIQLSLEISHRAYVLERGSIAMEGQGQKLLRDERLKESYLGL
jgi:branched-chain amino acid transport system ATP-binding protein